MEDKLIVVYEGTIAQYRGDWLKDEYVNKLVIVTGEQSSTSAEARKSYLCVSNGEKSVAIPIPSVYLQGIMLDGARYGYTDGYIRFAKANGIDLSFDVKTGDLSIGISEDLENTLSTLNVALTQVSTKADNAVSQAESATTKANEALSLAETASQNADKANNTITGVSNLVGNLRTTVEGNTSKIANIEGDVAENKAKIEAIEEDYISKGEAVDFATDLTGVIEATPEEFVYRPSAGDKSIRDKSAVIRRIKGNTTVWHQYAPSGSNPGVIPGDSNYLTVSIENSEWIGTVKNMGSGCSNPWRVGLRFDTPKAIANHKYLILMNIYTSKAPRYSDDYFTLEFGNATWYINTPNVKVGEWFSASRLFTQASDYAREYTIIRPYWSYTYGYGGQNGDYYKVKDVMFFDLTAMFGEGNEPATVEEFRKVYNEAYYPYCQPELRSMKPWAIKTVGFNLFNKNSAVVGVLTSTGSIDNSSSFTQGYFTARLKVLPNTTYYLLNVSNYYHFRSYVFYDAFENVISSGGLQADSSKYNASGTVTTPKDAAYMGVVIHKTFIDQCCVNFSHTGVRNGKYEPYVAHWLELPEILTLFPNGMNAVGDVFDEINIDTYIQRCEYRDYAEGDESNAEVLTDGVHTVAKLAEPIVKVLPEPITLDYYCEDWGSEEARPKDPSTPSAPFRADIVYQFNAEGRIRDNSRNIEKLEKIVAPLKVIPSDAPLATQGFVLSRIPTRVATATERVKMYEGQTMLTALLPNVMYDWTGGGSLLDGITIPPLNINTETIGTYDHKWMVRVGSDTSDKVTIPFDVLWKDGIAPNWTSWCICEITFKCDAQQDEAMRKIIGEWKIYR